MFKGLKGALAIVSALPPESRDSVLKLLAEKDSVLASYLKSNLISLEDLQYLSIKMLVSFLREISLKDLGLALKISSKELKEFLFKNVSSSMKLEIEETLNGKLVPVSKAYEAQEKILIILRKRLEEGKMVINKDKNDPLV